MKHLAKSGLYGILTEPAAGYERLTRAFVDAGVTIIQLRMKNSCPEDICEVARRLRGIIPSSVAFIINDDPILARTVSADGVHLGQDDMSLSEARRILGDTAIIGLSTHNPIQTREACAVRPDYIGVGPVFATPTKAKPDPVIGLDGMADMLSVATVPAVCLGGIDHSNVSAVLEHGARHICAVRCINASLEPEVEISKLLDVIGRYS